MSKLITESCCCGQISYTDTAVASQWYCHSLQCGKMAGHHLAVAQVSLSSFMIKRETNRHCVSGASLHGLVGEKRDIRWDSLRQYT